MNDRLVSHYTPGYCRGQCNLPVYGAIHRDPYRTSRRRSRPGRSNNFKRKIILTVINYGIIVSEELLEDGRTDGDLFRSAEFGRLDRIFVGIDVWARGCVGEFHCHESFALAKLFHISVALFAPGWIYEKFPDENQIVMGIRFWEKLKPHIRTRPLISANFSTNFCSGMEENWRFRLSSLELQPQHLSAFCHPIVGKGVVLFGRNRIFPLFTFDSIPLGKIEIICESDNAINVLWNHNEIAGRTGEHTWIISQSRTIESIEIQTANHDKTVIRRFSVSCINSKS
ncbi:unnamed protein product [Caenorhabditis sp. 36 PRJEB53466]|nr:unnamed protein product [Caenorhabditis sp. 36 PRJEB53466]